MLLAWLDFLRSDPNYSDDELLAFTSADQISFADTVFRVEGGVDTAPDDRFAERPQGPDDRFGFC